MEIKNSFVTYLYKLLHILMVAFVAVSCAQAPKVNFRNKTPETSQSARRDLPAGADAQDQTSGRLKFETKKNEKPFRPKVALVLGPGLARSFAHIGLLKEIKEAEIPLHSVVGMGMSALVAAEYVDQKSVHGLEWKASRSETLKKLSQTSFWSSALKEKAVNELEPLISSLLTDYKSRASRRGEFSCPLLSRRKNDLIFSDKRGLKNCIATPPLFNPGKNYAPYLFDLEAVRKGSVEMGAERVIYIDVISKSPKFFGSKESMVSGAVFWYWNFVYQMTQAGQLNFDKVVKIDVRSDILDFDAILDAVRSGQRAGGDLVDFLQEEYQY